LKLWRYVTDIDWPICANGVDMVFAGDSPYYWYDDDTLLNRERRDFIYVPNEDIKTYRLPKSVTNIGNSSFYDYSSLTQIEIPDGVTPIGDSAFRGCSSLTKIEIPESLAFIFQ